jgi:ABC-type sugar transport system permease subunit
MHPIETRLPRASRSALRVIGSPVPREHYETFIPDFADAGRRCRLRHFRDPAADDPVLLVRALFHARSERPSFPWLENFHFFFTDASFLPALQNTFTLLFSVMLVTVVLGTALGLLINEAFPGAPSCACC